MSAGNDPNDLDAILGPMPRDGGERRLPLQGDTPAESRNDSEGLRDRRSGVSIVRSVWGGP